jgi:hypothetical protein
VRIAFRLLPYFYLLLGALVFVSVILVLISMGSLIQENAHQTRRPHELAALMILTLIGAGLLIVYLVNAIFLLKRIKRKASLFLSLISCIAFPLGTIVGILSLFVLTRDEIKGQYRQP